MTKIKHETPNIYDLTYKRERCLCICYTLDCSKYWQIIKPAYLGKCHHLCKNWSNSYQNTMDVRKSKTSETPTDQQADTVSYRSS